MEREAFGNKYMIGRLDAIQQFHVMRRLGVVSSGLASSIVILQKNGGAKKLLESGGEGVDYRFIRFRPPPVEPGKGLPHIRLDRALEFLIGDRLA